MHETTLERVAIPRWIFGLPIDCLTLDEARHAILEAARTRTRLIFSTPNADFLVESSKDPSFQRDLLACDMCLADGAPVVWLGRAIGAPVPMRVAGSSLLDALIAAPGESGLRIFFFGGETGVARMASAELVRKGNAATSAGWLDPGFVTLDEMSTPEVLAEINAARPDFLVVALGAKKGHAWISRNADRLDVPVLSHLGAAIGFVAGTTKRAPRAFQAVGLEWLWRVAVEPRLARRYANDFLFLLHAVLCGLVPSLIGAALSRKNSPSLFIAEENNRAPSVIRLTGQLLGPTLSLLADYLQDQSRQDAVLDVSGVTAVDTKAIGYLYYLKYRCRNRVSKLICQPGSRAAMQFGRHRAMRLFG